VHLQQTKKASRKTGGPQYWFQDLSAPVKLFLRNRGAVRVALVTPYGATKSAYFAVSKVHKLDSQQQPVPGKAEHDRIQKGIGEAIRAWYRLSPGDFDRIDVDINIRDEVFYLTPLRIKYAGKAKTKEINRIDRPLTFTHNYKSPFWIDQLAHVNRSNPGIVSWSLDEICRIMKDHLPKTRVPNIQEQDLLRASGPLKHLGMMLGGYVGKGYDCFTSFRFLNFPEYSVHVEIKKNSKSFRYQEEMYGKEELSRAVVLCAIDDHKHIDAQIDVVELGALCKHAAQFPL